MFYASSVQKPNLHRQDIVELGKESPQPHCRRQTRPQSKQGIGVPGFVTRNLYLDVLTLLYHCISTFVQALCFSALFVMILSVVTAAISKAC